MPRLIEVPPTLVSFGGVGGFEFPSPARGVMEEKIARLTIWVFKSAANLFGINEKFGSAN